MTTQFLQLRYKFTIRQRYINLILINQLLNLGIQILVPSIKNGRLIAVKYSRGCVLKKGAFKINEPVDNIKFSKIKEIGVVIVPGIAFDRLGRRIGFGKGFYDQFLHKLPKTTVKIGIAFNNQVVPVIKHEEHDVHMNYILTEDGLIHAS